MDFIFLITGVICLTEAVLLLKGKDFMIFNDSTYRRQDYDLPRLLKAEAALFFADAAGCFYIAVWKPSMRMQLISIGAIFITLFLHWRNLCSGKYRIK